MLKDSESVHVGSKDSEPEESSAQKRRRLKKQDTSNAASVDDIVSLHVRRLLSIDSASNGKDPRAPALPSGAKKRSLLLSAKPGSARGSAVESSVHHVPTFDKKRDQQRKKAKALAKMTRKLAALKKAKKDAK